MSSDDNALDIEKAQKRAEYQKSILGVGGKLVKSNTPPEPGTPGSVFHYVSAKGIVHNYLVGKIVKVKCKISGNWRELRVEDVEMRFDMFYVRGKYIPMVKLPVSCESEYNCTCNDPDFVTDWIPEQDVCVNLY